jgi:hypothetical protein
MTRAVIRNRIASALVLATASFGGLGAVLADDNASSIDWERYYSLDGGLVGMRKDFVDGKGCDDGFTRSTYSTRIVSGEGNCAITGWLNNDPFDCRVNVHLGEAAFHGGRCYVAVYQHHTTGPGSGPTNPDSINWEHKFGLAGGPFGMRDDRVVGRGCDDGFTRTTYEAKIISGEGNCAITGWLNSDPFDCRAVLHRGEAAFKGGECQVTIHQQHALP